MTDAKPHYTALLKAFVGGTSGGLARIELVRLDLIKRVLGRRYVLTTRGRLRAERLGYLPKGSEATNE